MHGTKSNFIIFSVILLNLFFQTIPINTTLLECIFIKKMVECFFIKTFGGVYFY